MRLPQKVRLPPGLPRIWGDRIHLAQVLVNLLMNSIQAMQSCPPNARRIVVEARMVGGDVEIAVRDSGPGIPDEIGEKLFTPFFTSKPDGIGIGLALSRAIIEAHGGRLRVEHNSKPGGATLRFTLPGASRVTSPGVSLPDQSVLGMA